MLSSIIYDIHGCGWGNQEIRGISNPGLKVILENLDEQLADIRSDPRLGGLVDDLENLSYAYLKAWIKSNTEIIDILNKEKK